VIEVDPIVANKAREIGAAHWLADLDEIVGSLAAEWGLEVGDALAGGTEAYVTQVARADGSPAVLKLMIPRPDTDPTGQEAATHEATVLQLAGGNGCAELYANDVARGAILMERLGPSLHELGTPIADRHRIMIDCALRMWRPIPDADLTTGAAKARWLIDHVPTRWDELDRPCSERAVEHAISCGGRRLAAHDDERSVLVHGDIHQWNTLRSDRSVGTLHKLIDPDGLLAEPEYDLGVIMREDPVELMAGNPFDRASWLAAQTGLDADAIWEWGVVERVSTGLIATSIDLQPVGSEMLAAADAIAAQYFRS
jgi:streptomycin 6-kinase